MSVEKPPRDNEAESEAPNRNPTENDGATRVDLGEDLLDKTAMLTQPRSASSAAGGVPAGSAPSGPATAGAVPPEFEIEDQIQSARILMGEGILEEAKRILRKILIADGHHVEGRRMLEEIHEVELKQIFGETEGPRRRLGRREPESLVEASAETVLSDLDRDLGLGLGIGEGGREAMPSLFESREALEAFGEKMDRDFAGASVPERIDLGIAFLEMGLHDLAIRHFNAAVHRLTLEPETGQGGDLLSATGLLAHALLAAGRPFDAAMAMQALLGDAEVPRARKLDLLYLMGRAQEAMGKQPSARAWYQQAAELDPRYRDVAERLRAGQGAPR